tara:strand:- start:2278 stop:2460 length:183 start_codon:yes stop_codon:yes gene_type:complete
MKKKSSGNEHDWQNLKGKENWPYKGLDDPKYIKDRSKIFKMNGNGWWYIQGTRLDNEKEV